MQSQRMLVLEKLQPPKKQKIIVPSERFPGRLQVLQDAVVPEGKSWSWAELLTHLPRAVGGQQTSEQDGTVLSCQRNTSSCWFWHSGWNKAADLRQLKHGGGSSISARWHQLLSDSLARRNSAVINSGGKKKMGTSQLTLENGVFCLSDQLPLEQQ